MGAQKRQHHKQQEALRAAAAAANQQKAMMKKQQEAFEKQLKLQQEAMFAQTKRMQEALAPTPTQSTTLGQAGLGIKVGGSKKKTVTSMAKGASALKIPLNVGGTTGGGLNIG